MQNVVGLCNSDTTTLVTEVVLSGLHCICMGAY